MIPFSLRAWGFLSELSCVLLGGEHKGELRRMQDSTESSRDSNPISHNPLDSVKCSCLRKISDQGGRTAEPEFCAGPEAFLLEAEQEVGRLMEEFSVLLHRARTPWKRLLLTGKGTHSLSLLGGEFRSRSESHKEKRILRGDSCF